jgi:hypothetical protein
MPQEIVICDGGFYEVKGKILNDLQFLTLTQLMPEKNFIVIEIIDFAYQVNKTFK